LKTLIDICRENSSVLNRTKISDTLYEGFNTLHIADRDMRSSAIQKKKVIITLQWQDWLSENSTILRYPCIVYFVGLFIEAGFHRRMGW
jgi:hypothetical protein